MVELQTLLLNVRKQKEVQLSLLNDVSLRNYGALFITEPHAWPNEEGELVTVPITHANWTKLIPTKRSDERWQIRSMLWVREDLEVEQIPIKSSDLTAAVLHTQDSAILIVSAYVEGGSEEVLNEAVTLIKQAALQTRHKYGPIELIIAGDFNRHDALWGGDKVSPNRQGEAEPLLLLMDELALTSLLPRGTITWQSNDSESTIDLILASEGLTSNYQHCKIYEIEHGSDHRAICTQFEVTTPERQFQPKPLFKNAPWNQIRERVKEQLSMTTRPADTQAQADRLLQTVETAVKDLTPLSKPSTYAKRWWTQDLTSLRDTYTKLRNRARSTRRRGGQNQQEEQEAKEAAKQYHKAIRTQKKAHWEDFLTNETNIWSAARFIKPGKQSAFGKIPRLKRSDGEFTESKEDQARELLTTFFPPLPLQIDEEEAQLHKPPLPFTELQQHEIRAKIYEASQWKAPGPDGLPAAVWRELWPIVKDDVTDLFRSSIKDSYLPHQWRQAKIVPLRKPGKENYAIAKAWRPISLLSTLGKVLEAVIAERISFLAEEHGLLPQNHFGARRRRSAEQALLLLQNKITETWRNKRVLSLISFDVKGAYNGVHKERLQQRLIARRIPQVITNWVAAFCSNRSASIIVNGQEMEKEQLADPGLPQGSPLSPILFLFYNADLVQRKITAKEGAMAFVDDYTVWVANDSISENYTKLNKAIDEALNWERRSGATFEGDKTAFIHFTRTDNRASNEPLWIKGQEVKPSDQIKLLGVIFDKQLRFKEHVARAVSRGLKAALALSRLKAISPSTACQLFSATVAPVIDYGATIWWRAAAASTKAFNTTQKIGARAVTGAFKTVAREVAEAEASLLPAKQRHETRAAAAWIDILTLPPDHPLRTNRLRETRRFRAPLLFLRDAADCEQADRLETILPYAVAPWHAKIELKESPRDKGQVIRSNGTPADSDVTITTVTAQKKGYIGCGAAIWIRENVPTTFIKLNGASSEQNHYAAELTAIATALESLIGALKSAPGSRRWTLTWLSRNRAAMQAVSRPARQSNQRTIQRIYEARDELQSFGIAMTALWTDAEDEVTNVRNKLQQLIRKELPINEAQGQNSVMKSVLTAATKARIAANIPTSNNIGRAIKAVDAAFPGKHTKTLYRGRSKAEAGLLVQLRTGACRLNEYLFEIGVAESALCACNASNETVRHFLFTCNRWNEERRSLLAKWPRKMGDTSLFLGGRAPTEEANGWRPNLTAVEAMLAYVKATARLSTKSGGN